MLNCKDVHDSSCKSRVQNMIHITSSSNDKWMMIMSAVCPESLPWENISACSYRHHPLPLQPWKSHAKGVQKTTVDEADEVPTNDIKLNLKLKKCAYNIPLQNTVLLQYKCPSHPFGSLGCFQHKKEHCTERAVTGSLRENRYP